MTSIGGERDTYADGRTPPTASEARFRALFEQSPLCTVLHDADGRPVQANAAFERLWGVPFTAVPPGYSAFDDPQLVAAGVADLMRRAFAGEVVTAPPVRFDASTASDDARGRTRWVASHFFPLRDPDGVVRQVVVQQEDVTARLEEEAGRARRERRQRFLDELRERLDALQHAMARGAAPADPDALLDVACSALGTFLGVRLVNVHEVDQAAARVTVHAGHGSAGPGPGTHPLSALFAPETSARLARGEVVAVRDVRDDPRTAARAAAFEGRGVRACVAVPLMRDGAWVGTLVLGHDAPRDWTEELPMVRVATERTWLARENARLVAALRTSEESLRVTLEATEIGFWTWDPATWTGTITAQNARLFGLPAPDGPATASTYLALLHPADAARVEAAFVEAAHGGRPYDVEYRIVRPDGALRWIHSTGRLLRGIAPGAGARFVGVSRDTTERRTAESREQSRAARLQALTAALAAARGVADVARVVAEQGRAAFGAFNAAVALLDGAGRTFRVVAADGAPSAYLESWWSFPADAPVPYAEAAATRTPLLIRSRAEYAARFPVLAPLVARLGVEATAVLPLVTMDAGGGAPDADADAGADGAAGRVLGVAHFDFDDAARLAEVSPAALVALAQQCAQALERAALAEAVADSLALLDGVFADAPVGLAFFDRDLRYLRINAELAGMNGLPVDAHLGRRLEEVLPELAGAVNPLFQRVLDTGEPIRGLDVVDDYPVARGGPRHWRASYFPVRRGGRPDGEIIAVGVAAEDVTEQVRQGRDREFLFALGAELQRAAAPRVAPDAADPPRAVAAVGLRLLADYLDVDRAVFLDVITDVATDVATDADEAAEWSPEGTAVVPRAQYVRGGRALATSDPIVLAEFGPVLVGRASRGEVHAVADVDGEPSLGAGSVALAARDARAFVHVPLWRGARWCASLAVSCTVPRAWSARDVALVQAVAERLWPAIETARALEAEQTARARAERLQSFTASLAAAVRVEEIAAATLREGLPAIGAAAGAVVRVAPDDAGVLEIVGSSGYPDASMAEWERFPIGSENPAAEAVRTGAPVWVATADGMRARFPRTAGLVEASGFPSWLAIPFTLADADAPGGRRAVGVFGVAFGEPRAPDAELHAFLLALGQQVAQALERVRLLDAERAARAEAEQARVRAAEANRAKSEFLANMSHELRTPLNAIQGHAQLLEMELHGPVTPAQREALGRIARAQQHLLGLINDVLNYAKLEAGRVEYRLQPVALGAALTDVATMLAPQMAAAGLAFSTTWAGDECAAIADEEKLRQVLLNLLSNAAKFTPAGGAVTLEAAQDAADPGTVHVRVRDTGIGIPADKLEAVFAPFVQVDASRTRRTEGTGLGLAISRDLARGMGGDLMVESVPGVGSTFTLALRRAPRPTEGDDEVPRDP